MKTTTPSKTQIIIIYPGGDNSEGWDFGYLQDDQKEELKKLLQELANTPLLKIPIWIEQHKEELEKLGVKVEKEMKKDDKTNS